MTDEKDQKDDKWVMPKPVFRSSSGSMPKSLEETIHESNFPSAETIEISAETKEIDEDDDILSILQENAAAKTLETVDLDGEITIATDPLLNSGSDDLDGEITIETEPRPDPAPEPTPEPVAPAETAAPVAEKEAPVVVTAKKSKPKAKPKKKSRAGSFLIIFLLIAILAAGIVFGLYYFLTNYKPGGGGPF